MASARGKIRQRRLAFSGGAYFFSVLRKGSIRQLRELLMKASNQNPSHVEEQKQFVKASRRQTRWWTYVVGIVCLAAAWPLYRYNLSYLKSQAGFAEMEAGDFVGAISILENEERTHPKNAETVYCLAIAHRRAGHFQVFQDCLFRAKKMAYSQDEIHRQLLLFRLQTGETGLDLEEQADELIARSDSYQGPREDLFVDEFYEARAQGYLVNYRLFDAELTLDHWIQARPNSLPARLLRADVFYRGMNLEAAEREYQEVLSRTPDNISARLKRADLLKLNNKAQAAEDEYRICLKYAPQNFQAQLGLAGCEFRGGQKVSEARERLLALLQQELDSHQRAETLFLIGEISRSQKDDESAIKYLTEGLSLSAPSDATAYNTLSAAHASQGNREEAVKYLQLARDKGARDARMYDIRSKIIQAPTNALLRLEQGNVYYDEGMKDEAANWWNMAVRFDPKLQVAHEALADYYTLKGDKDRVEYHRGMAEQAAISTFDRLWLDLLDSNVKSVRDGLPQLTRYSSMQDPVELLTVGLDVVERKNLEDAVPVLDRLSHHPKLRLRALTLLGEVLYVTGHFKAAEQSYLEVLSLSPRNIVAHRGLQAIYFDLGDYGRMQHHALQVAEIDPTDFRPHRHLGYLRREEANWTEAIIDYKESLRRNPHQPSREEVLLELADCYIHDLDYSEALAALADVPPSAQKSFLEAQCKYATKEVSQAKSILDESLKTTPDHVPTLLLRADIALVAQDSQQAREFLERAVKASPYDSNAHLKLSTVLLRLDEKEAATREGARAKELLDLQVRFSDLNTQAAQRPTDITVRKELASVARQLGREEDAIRWKRVVDALTEESLATKKGPPSSPNKLGTERLLVPDLPTLSPRSGPPTDKKSRQPQPAPQFGPKS